MLSEELFNNIMILYNHVNSTGAGKYNKHKKVALRFNRLKYDSLGFIDSS